MRNHRISINEKCPAAEQPVEAVEKVPKQVLGRWEGSSDPQKPLLNHSEGVFLPARPESAIKKIQNLVGPDKQV